MSDENTVYLNYLAIKERIAEACGRAGRDAANVRLIAVSKTKPLSDISALYDKGVRGYGENKVQELSEKAEALPEAQWHMIGHLQRNKVRALLKHKPVLIHSLDSFRLAAEIDKEAEKLGLVQRVLVEINIGAEENKSGIAPEELKTLAAELRTLENIDVAGLMCVAPKQEYLPGGEKELHELFARMRTLLEELKEFYPEAGELSMGMTQDFEIAAEEGATIIRVGSAIFGERVYL